MQSTATSAVSRLVAFYRPYVLFCVFVNDSVSAQAKHRCTQPAGVTASHVCHTALAAGSGDVTVHSDRPERTVTAPEFTVASGQHGLTDMAGGHSGWYTDWLSIHRREALYRQTTQKIYQILPYLIAANPGEFWKNSPYNTANTWRQIGDELSNIKSSQNRENDIRSKIIVSQ